MTSRETLRDALGVLLEAELVGAGLPVKTVTTSQLKIIEGLTPLVKVLSAGSMRERMTLEGDKFTAFFELQVWVLQEGTGWTLVQAEDALDTIEALIAGIVESERETANWGTLEYDGRSIVSELKTTPNGKLYFREMIPIRVNTIKS